MKQKINRCAFETQTSLADVNPQKNVSFKSGYWWPGHVSFSNHLLEETQTLSTFYCHSILDLDCDLCVMNIDSVCSSSAVESVVNADERFMLIPCTVLATLRAFLWKILPRF